MSGNKLIFQIQPNEGIDISIISKTPGYERRLEENTLSFRYDLSKAIPESYQQVLVDVIYSNQELFISDREVIESWRIIDEIEKL